MHVTSNYGASNSTPVDSGRSNETRGDLSRYISSPLPQLFLLSALLAGGAVPVSQAQAQTAPEAPVANNLGPTVTILSPQFSDLIKGKAQVLIAVKTQRYAPEFVEMFVDDRPVTYDPATKSAKIRLEVAPSAAFDWATTRFTDGPHSLKVRITDTQGFIGEAEVTVYVNNGTERDTAAPVLEWLNIQSGQVLNGKVNVQLQARDNFGVKYVIVSLNPTETPDRKPPAWAWFFNRPPYSVSLDTVKIPDGTYIMRGTAYDVLENEGQSPPLYIGIANNTINATSMRARLSAFIGVPQGVTAPDAKVDPPVEAPTEVKVDEAVPGPVPVPLATPPATAPTVIATRPDEPTQNKPSGFQLPSTSIAEGHRSGAAKIESSLSNNSRLGSLRNARPLSASKPPRKSVSPQAVAAALGMPVRPTAPTVFTAPAMPNASTERIPSVNTSNVRSTLPPENRATAWLRPPVAAKAVAGTTKSVVGTSRPVAGTTKSVAGTAKTVTGTTKPAFTATSKVASASGASTVQKPPTFIATRPTAPEQHGVSNRIDPLFTVQRRSAMGAITEASLVTRPGSIRTISVRLSAPSANQSQGDAPPVPRYVTGSTVLPTGGQSAIVVGAPSHGQGQSSRPLRSSAPVMAYSPDIKAGNKNATINSITVSPIAAGKSGNTMPVTYVAQRNETLEAVARRFNLPIGVLAANNKLKANARLTKGTTVKLPQALTLSYEGKPVTADVAPMLVDSTAVAAFRFLFEKQGGTVTWDAAAQQVKARNVSHEITLTIGSKEAVVNQKAVMMDLAAFLLSGRTMVPVRLFEKALHAQVEWDPSSGRIYVAMTN